MSYNVRAILHPEDAAGRAILKRPPINLIYSYVHDLRASQTSLSAATTLERWARGGLTHTSLTSVLDAQNKRMS